MSDKNKLNNPQKTFKEQDALVIPGERKPVEVEREELTSIRDSEIISIVPADIDWSKIYIGKQHGLYTARPEVESPKKGRRK